MVVSLASSNTKGKRRGLIVRQSEVRNKKSRNLHRRREGRNLQELKATGLEHGRREKNVSYNNTLLLDRTMETKRQTRGTEDSKNALDNRSLGRKD